MSNTSVFLPLIRHESSIIRSRKNGRRHSKGWRYFYAAVILLVVLAATPFISLNGDFFGFQTTWYFSYGLLFATCGISIRQVNREFQSGTAGWWLSLPYSRSTLVITKAAGSLVQAVRIIAVGFGLIFIWGLYVMLLNPGTFSHDFIAFVQAGVKWLMSIIAFTPFVVGFGTMMAIIGKTKARPALPLLWILIWGGTSALYSSSMEGKLLDFVTNSGYPYSLYILIPLISSWMFAVIMISAAIYLLKHKLSI